MAKMSTEQLAQRALDLDLITEYQLRDVWSEFGSRNVSIGQLQQLFLRRELLTNYQIERLLDGQKTGFFYGDYKVLYLVGAGTFARVYRAAHRRDNRLVAVKILRRRFSDDPEQTDRFYREGQLGSSLRHPNIVPIYEVFSQAGTHYIVMEFVEGNNLRDFIKVRRLFDSLEATRIMIDVAKGLDYASQRGLTHRDIKMSNVLLSSRGRARLVDFGLAGLHRTMSDEALAELHNPRTIDYAGLERATKVGKDDSRSDIFFVGCMYYHMLSGRPAMVETRDRIQRLSTTRFRNISSLLKVASSVPNFLALIVNKAIEFDPDRRYQSFAEMLVDLQLAMKKLGTEKGSVVEDPRRTPNFEESEGLDEEGRPKTLMIVEADEKMQNVFRQQLKRKGYRVLVTSDPKRAIFRFTEYPGTVDLVLFSTGALGQSALDAFKELDGHPATNVIPSILLLDERHRGWRKEVQPNERHVVVDMPLKFRQLRELLVELLLPEGTNQE